MPSRRARGQTGPHIFVDESKHRGFLLAAAIVMPGDLVAVRRGVRALRMHGQERIHFTAESAPRRRSILSALADLPVKASVYEVPGRDVKDARDAAMTALVDDVAKIGAVRLVIEQDDQAVISDRKIIRERSERAGCLDTLSLQHCRPQEECLLAIPDAVAWSWAKGGDWRRRARPIVSEAFSL